MTRLPASARLRAGTTAVLGSLALILAAAEPVWGIIIIGSSAGNTSAPTDPGLGERWNQVGNFSSYLGTPIASQFFLTAKHLGNLTGQAITFPDSTSYTTTAQFADPNSDLAIYQISGTFPNDKIVPMYSGAFTFNQSMTIFGRGRSRTDTAVVGQKSSPPGSTENKGWTWGSSTGNRSWGTNTLDGLTTLPGANAGAGVQLVWDFDVGGGSSQGVLATNDSGGPVFMQEGGIWKLAGINYAVGPISVRETAAGPTLEAAVYDYGGLYLLVNGTWTLQSASGGDKPAVSYSSSVPDNAAWVQSIVTVPVPEPAGLALVGAAAVAAGALIRRRNA